MKADDIANHLIPNEGILDEKQAAKFVELACKESALLDEERIICLYCGKEVFDFGGDKYRTVSECGCGVFRHDASKCIFCCGDGRDCEGRQCDQCHGTGLIWRSTKIGGFIGIAEVDREEKRRIWKDKERE